MTRVHCYTTSWDLTTSLLRTVKRTPQRTSELEEAEDVVRVAREVSEVPNVDQADEQLDVGRLRLDPHYKSPVRSHWAERPSADLHG